MRNTSENKSMQAFDHVLVFEQHMKSVYLALAEIPAPDRKI